VLEIDAVDVYSGISGNTTLPLGQRALQQLCSTIWTGFTLAYSTVCPVCLTVAVTVRSAILIQGYIHMLQ
jgi:hypothetical protein